MKKFAAILMCTALLLISSACQPEASPGSESSASSAGENSSLAEPAQESGEPEGSAENSAQESEADKPKTPPSGGGVPMPPMGGAVGGSGHGRGDAGLGTRTGPEDGSLPSSSRQDPIVGRWKFFSLIMDGEEYLDPYLSGEDYNATIDIRVDGTFTMSIDMGYGEDYSEEAEGLWEAGPGGYELIVEGDGINATLSEQNTVLSLNYDDYMEMAMRFKRQ